MRVFNILNISSEPSYMYEHNHLLIHTFAFLDGEVGKVR